MANVMFKRGLSTALPSGSNIVDGAFYLTTDTNHLYIGKESSTGEKSLAKINGNIHAVNILPATGEPGEFYYLPGQNILAYYDTNKWVQLNPDTDTDTKVVSAKFDKNVDESNLTELVYDVTLGRTDITGKAIDAVTTKFKINSADVTSIVTKTEVSVNATVNEGTATVKTNGAGSAGSGFTVTGGDNVTISGSKDALVISATDTNTTYELSSAAGKTDIVLTASSGNTDTVKLIAGEQIALDGSKAGEITINHADITVAKDPSNTPGGKLSHGDELTVVSGITQDDNGHVTGYATTTYTLPEDNDTTNATITIAAGSPSNESTQGDLTVSVTDSKGATITGTLDAGLYYEVDGEKIYNQNDLVTAKYFADLRSDVDQLSKNLSGIDALRYRGTLGVGGTVTSLPTENVQIGDTYKVAVADTYNGIECELGDLLIATGVEGTDGYISGTITWTLVAQGSDTDTTYTLNGVGNEIVLTASTGGKTSIGVEGDTDVSITVANDKLTVKHNDVARTDSIATNVETIAHDATIDVVTAVASSTTGHITGITTKKYQLPEDKNTTYTLPVEQVTDKSHSKITLTGTDGEKDIVNFKADRSTNTSLSVSGTEDTITYKHTDYSYTAPTTTAAGVLAHNGKLTVVTGAEVDNGHITSLKTTEYTLPEDKDTTYELTGAITTTNVEGKTSAIKVTDTLTSSKGDTTASEFTITSNTLNLTAGTGNYNVDLVWGSF